MYGRIGLHVLFQYDVLWAHVFTLRVPLSLYTGREDHSRFGLLLHFPFRKTWRLWVAWCARAVVFSSLKMLTI